jgi:hypothetical protein
VVSATGALMLKGDNIPGIEPKFKVTTHITAHRHLEIIHLRERNMDMPCREGELKCSKANWEWGMTCFECCNEES